MRKKPVARRTQVGSRRIDERYKGLRKKVFERDNYTCMICKSTKKLRMHHIVRYRDSAGLRYAERNCCTVCNSCHVYKVTGKESMWKAFFTRKVSENTKKFKDENKKENENEEN